MHVDTLGFIIEYADSLHDAQHYLYEDGAKFPMHMGETAILDGIRIELLKIISETGNPATTLVTDMKIAV